MNPVSELLGVRENIRRNWRDWLIGGTFLLAIRSARFVSRLIDKIRRWLGRPARPALVLCVVAVVLVGCAGTELTSYRKALTMAERVYVAALDADEKHAETYQQGVVDATRKACASSPDRTSATACVEREGRAALAAHRQKRAAVEKALSALALLIVGGEAMLSGAEAGAAPEGAAAWLAKVLGAVDAVQAAMAGLGGGAP